MPKFETIDDLTREAATKQRFIDTRKSPIKFFKMREIDKLDYFVTNKNNRGLAVAEIKCRTVPWGTYDSVMLSAAKWREALSWRHNFLTDGKTLFDFLLITSWKDKCQYYKYSEDHDIKIEYGGRTNQTRVENDIEPVVKIPNKYFTEF